MNYSEFLTLVKKHKTPQQRKIIIPITKRCSADLLTPVSAFLALRQKGICSFLLESVEGGEKMARYSFLGSDPFLIVEAEGATVNYIPQRNSIPLPLPAPEENIYGALRFLLDCYDEIKLPQIPRFTGGAVGFMGYDTIQLVERVPPPPMDTLNLPDASWCFYDTVAAFDHVKHQIVLMASIFIADDTDLKSAFDEAQSRIEALESTFKDSTRHSPEPVQLKDVDLQSNIAREHFEAAVDKGKSYIYEGDIFQVVLSQRFELGFEGDHFNLYRALRQVNPSPYLFYIDYVDYTLVGSSPEVLVRVENGDAEVLPIAGTRKRGATIEEDEALELELLNDPKERAEHLMLVDLGRNDLGRVCTYNSVTVHKYAYIERYSHVMHIVSSVVGKVKPNQSPIDVLAACFPAGTVSGAPKVRAMEIIAELEPTKRGIYAGAVGYLDFSGNMDTCIAIRTMVIQGNKVYIQAGAGIVADSSPALEFEETENKARALKQALLMAGADLL